MEPTKSELWARTLSTNLKNSFDSLGLIKHKLTSGEAREHQVLDVLKYILPKKFSLHKNVVIINSDDQETIKFDGAFIDDSNWPMLFASNHLIISPIESVKIVFEIKSHLGNTEIKKLYKEAINIGYLSDKQQFPQVAGFAYQCKNIKLAYFDFANNFLSSDHFPALIAILNVGILCPMRHHPLIPEVPGKSYRPVLLETGPDTLLIFIYLLTERISNSSIAHIIRSYSSIYESVPFFCFDDYFLEAMRSDPGKLRNTFKGNLDMDIRSTYSQAIAKFF
jgi:hypothetical protein